MTDISQVIAVTVNVADARISRQGFGTPLILDLLEATYAPPVQAVATTSTTGGTLAAATYFYVVTAFNFNGETLKSNERSIVTTGATSSNTVSWAAVPGAVGYKIYRGTVTNTENVFYVVGNVLTFLDTGAVNTAGTPPTVYTAGGF